MVLGIVVLEENPRAVVCDTLVKDRTASEVAMDCGQVVGEGCRLDLRRLL